MGLLGLGYPDQKHGTSAKLGSPCWSQLSEANVLMLIRTCLCNGWSPRQVGWGLAPVRVVFLPAQALCFLLLSSLKYVPAQPQCREEEYPVDDECCPKCSPGYHVKHACSELTGTVCIPCPPKTYTAHPNGLSQCLPCGDCNPDMGMVTWQNCSSMQDTVCHCKQGYFCETEEGDHCVLCLPHTACLPGQRVLTNGTHSQDTVCVNCLLGTFSSGGTQEKCLPWTKCQQWFQTETEQGTSSTDVTCSFSWVFYFSLASFGVVILLIIVWLWKKRQHSKSSLQTSSAREVLGTVQESSTKQRHENLATMPLQQMNRQDKALKFSVSEEITTEAVEETALNS